MFSQHQGIQSSSSSVGLGQQGQLESVTHPRAEEEEEAEFQQFLMFAVSCGTRHFYLWGIDARERLLMVGPGEDREPVQCSRNSCYLSFPGVFCSL